ncbi:MAG: slipin family protein [Candidatus Micrarchaeia archaeon]
MALLDALLASASCLPLIGFALLIILLATFRVIYEYERAVVFQLGKYHRTLKPGLHIVIPVIDSVRTVDLRIKTVDIPKQEVMTKDNVPVSVNAVVYFKVEKPEDAVLKIENYMYAVSQYGQTALRDVIGNKELDFVLTERDEIATEIKKLVDQETSEWGIDITSIKIQDIELPADMKRAMARQAEAEREKRATIIMAEGELQASLNLKKAAENLSGPGALHLRTLQTVADVSADQSNTVVVLLPIEVLEAIKGLGVTLKKGGKAKEE